jgi:hypothetical protein
MIVAGRRAQRRTTFENRYAFLPLPLSIHHSFDVVVGYYSSRRKKKKTTTCQYQEPYEAAGEIANMVTNTHTDAHKTVQKRPPPVTGKHLSFHHIHTHKEAT